MLDKKIISQYSASVNFTELSTRDELTADSVIAIETNLLKDDAVSNMKIFFGDILVYDGEPISEFSYTKSELPDTDYTMKVEIITARGLNDYVTKRVICR